MTTIRYPEIESAGGLAPALNSALESIGSSQRVSARDDLDILPVTYNRIVNNGKFSQIYLAANEKLYLPDFWRDGVCLAHGQINNIKALAECIDCWLTMDIRTDELAERFPFIKPSKDAIFFDDGDEVEYKWHSIQDSAYDNQIKSFVDLAIKDPILSKLFPYTSLVTLCFSRCTGYPYTYDTPTVSPIWESGQYLVRTSDEREIGRGSAAEALKMVLDNLPSDIGPAVKGTSETI